MSMHHYRGFEIHPLIYPRTPTRQGCTRNYDAGFDAAVRISLCGAADALPQSQTFRLLDDAPFATAGDARRASLRYAERVIDGHSGQLNLLAEAP